MATGRNEGERKIFNEWGVIPMDSEMEIRREIRKTNLMFDLVTHLHGGRSPP